MLISVTELTSQIIVGANFSFQLDIPQKLKEWSENFPREKILSDNETLESLQKELDKHCDIFSRQIPLQDQASSPEKNFMTAFEELIACINAFLTNPELASATYADYNRLVENSCNPSGYNTFMPLCVLPTTKQGFLHYLRKFVAPDEKLEHLSKSELRELYLSFTPQKAIEIPSHENASSSSSVCLHNKSMDVRCYYCGSGQCSECPVNTLSFPQLHITDKHVFCSACVELLHQECTDLWLEKAISLIQEESIHAALGCMTMAVYSGGNSDTKIFKCLKALYKNGFSLAALPLTVNFINTCTDADLLVQARYFLANMLQYVSRKNCPEDSKDNLFFLLASAIAFTPESIYNGQIHSSINIPNLPRLQQEVQSSLDQRQLNLLSAYKQFWHEKSWTKLMNYFRKGGCFVDAENYEVLKKFITDMQTSDIKEEEERNVFLFLRGILSINEGRLSEGVENIECAIWNHHSPTCLQQQAVVVMIKTLPQCLSIDDSKTLLNAGILLEYSAGKISSRIANLVFAMAFELEPPSKNMFARGILNLDYSMHEREVTTLRHFEQGMLMKREVAIEYVNLMQYSSNYSQNIMCHLLASLWYLQHLHDIPKSSRAERFSIKKLIFYLLDQVLLKTRIYHSHPGFQLYAETIALKIITNILQTSNDIISPEDNKLAAQTLSTVLCKSRMCPLWDVPIVLVSEVDHIDKVTGTLHSKYLQGLEDVDTTQLPIHKADLMYYLYENDLRLSESKNMDQGPQMHHYNRSMEELLKEKNWTYEDIVQRMTSPMDPRDSEGWLIPSSGRLGVNYEYSELKGLVVNHSPFSSSIELVFEPATREKPGVLSMKDVQSFMQLDFEDIFPLHFSLDPPDVEKPYHPFQEAVVNKKLPRAIQHTLFQTDYLMKSFSVGSDISSKPPFKQRSCKDGLTKHLPPNLQEATRSIQERPGQKSGRSMSRFWIQADSVSYQSSQTSSRQEFRFGDVDIKVRSHPIIPSRDGNLHDTAEDLDPDSAEAHFAADLTNNYKELSLYFPEYARLYEFGKLQAVKIMLHAIESHLKEKGLQGDLPAVLNKFKLFPTTTDHSCYWVPAAIHEEHTPVHFLRCYGGVLFAPQLVNGLVAKFSPTSLSVPVKPPKIDEEDDSSSNSSAAGLGLFSLPYSQMVEAVPYVPKVVDLTLEASMPNQLPKQSLQTSRHSHNTRQHQQHAQQYQRINQQPVQISRPTSRSLKNQSTGGPTQLKHPVAARKQQSAGFQQYTLTVGKKHDHPVLPKSQSCTKSFTCDVETLRPLNNSSLGGLVSKLAENTYPLQIPLTVAQKISQHISLATARIFLHGSSNKGSLITFQPPCSTNLCPCTYRYLISCLMSDDTFECNITGEKYKLIHSHVDCKMRNVIYMVEISINGKKIQYVGLTTQEFWKRIYQHFTKSYMEYIRGSNEDAEKRGLSDEIVACFKKIVGCFEDLSSPPTISLKKALVRLLAEYVKIRPIAWFQGSHDTSKEDIQVMLAVAETVFIEKFNTCTDGANKTVGLKNVEGKEMDSRIYVNILLI